MKRVLLIAVLVALGGVFIDQTFQPKLEGTLSVEEVTLACKYTSNDVPPRPFASDGCTLFPETLGVASLTKCCIAHDARYWCGGEEVGRADADLQFAECIHDRVPVASIPLYWGAHLGGVSWLPFPWRWGFGWPYFEIIKG